MRKTGKVSHWQWLRPVLRPQRAALAALYLATVLCAALQVALAALSRYVVDAGLAGQAQFWTLGAALLAVLLAITALRGALSWTAGKTADRSAAQLRHALLRAAEQSSAEQLRAFHSGALLSRSLEDVKLLCDAVTGLIPALLGDAVRFVGAFVILTAFYPALAAVLALVCLAICVGAAVSRPALRRRHAQVRKAEEESLSQLQEYAQQLELLQALGAQEEALRRYDRTLDRSLKAKRQRRVWSLSGSTAVSALSQVGTGCLLLWGVRAVYTGALSFGALTSVFQLLALLRKPAVSLSGAWGRLTAAEVSAQRLQDILKTHERQPAQTEPEPLQVAAVVFEDVTFRYKIEEPPVLEHFSARIDLTGWTCLSGISGRGKTTVFKLILGIYRPQSGRVYLQTDRGLLPCGEDTRRLFAYVPQDFTLFSGSIRENLLLVSPQADDRMCEAALDIAQAHFVRELRAGLDTQVKEQRAGLSMGQLQRIAIARAVLMERPVLLLDECTSALDSETELAVLTALRALGCGAVFVTHRPQALGAIGEVGHLNMEKTT